MNAPLNGDQFAHNTGDMMSMRRIKKLPAVDTGQLANVSRQKGSLVNARYESGGLLDSKTDDVADSSRHGGDYYNDLRETMRAGGPDAIPPVHVDTANNIAAAYGGSGSESDFGDHMALGNGGHRVAIAHELGWKSMRTTTDIEKSGYGDEDNYENGPDDFSGGNYGDSYHSPSSQMREVRSRVPTGHGKGRAVVWHHGGGPEATHGLHTDIHPALSGDQFSNRQQGGPQQVPGQGKLPGMPQHFAGGGPTSWAAASH